MTESWQEFTSSYPRTFSLMEPALKERSLKKFLVEWHWEDGEKQKFLFPMFLRTCGLSALAQEVLAVEVSLAQADRLLCQQGPKSHRNIVRVELSTGVFGLPKGLFAIGVHEGKTFFVKLNVVSALIIEALDESFGETKVGTDWNQLRGEIQIQQSREGKSFSQGELDQEFIRLVDAGLLSGIMFSESSLARKEAASVEEGIFPLR